MQLSSAKNPVLQSVRRAIATGRPTEEGLIAVEGPHLLREALRSSWTVETVFASGAALARHTDVVGQVRTQITEVTASALSQISGTENDQGIIALLRAAAFNWKDLLRVPRPLLMVLDNIQDPGNAGTIIRSAEAFGATGIIFLSGSVQIANGKFLRASAGSIFRLPFLRDVSGAEFLRKMQDENVAVYALDSRARASIEEMDLSRSCAFVTGNEGAGLSEELIAGTTAVRIETKQVESLNAAIASSIALYEAQRKRAHA